MPPKTKKYARKKRTYNRKKKTYARKPTVKQVRQIAKKVLLGEAESKYYDVESLDNLSKDPGPGSLVGSGLTLGIPRAGYPAMQVIGFAAGSAAQVGGGGILRYGLDPATGNPRAIFALQHGRVFAAGDANGYGMEGSYTSPSLNITTFNLQRVIVDTQNDTLSNTTTPYYIRCVRVVPRPIKSSRSNMNPESDLFLDQFSQEIGVTATNFNQYELQMYKVNSKKYKVIQDFNFMMNPPLTYNQLDIGGGTYQVSTVNGGARKQMTFKHDIGKKLFYQDPRLNSNPSDGFHNEFIFFHVIPIGSENLFGISPDDVRIAAKPVGTFKDI